mmetsp:Transcript_8964/g.12339  ORF Transcript_8964/g.12339 Transcript_8964/m.12339 type:complete len:215 (+) Transcript_8964:169-813(+)
MSDRQKEIEIDVVSDTICPWCYMGKKQLENAMKEKPDIKFTIRWHPFFLNPHTPKEGIPKMQYLNSMYGESRVNVMHKQLDALGEKFGIKFNHSGMIVPTLDSHRLIEYAQTQGKQNEVVEALFHAYFVNAENINDRHVLQRIGEQAGLSKVKEFLNGHEFQQEVVHEDAEYKQRGIHGVPFFTISAPGKPRRLTLSGSQPIEYFLDAFDELTS